VASVDTTAKKLILSFNLKGTSKAEKKSNQGAAPSIALGSVVSGVVKGVCGDALEIELTAECGSTLSATLAQSHLSDHPEHAAALFACYGKIGTKLAELLVLTVSKSGAVQLSMKPALLFAAKSKSTSLLPTSITDLSEGALLLGVVSNLADYGLFVSFLGHLSGLAPRAELCDSFVTSPADHFALGQTVLARVLTVDRDSNKFTLSLKPSKTDELARSDEVACQLNSLFARSLFTEHDLIQDAQAKGKKRSAQDWSPFQPGSVVSGTVQLVKADVGVLLSFAPPTTESKAADAVQGLAVLHQTSASHKVGDSVKCRVLDVDRTKRIVDVSLRPEIGTVFPCRLVCRSFLSVRGADKTKKLRIGESVPVEVQLVRKQYFVLSLPKHGHAIAFAATTAFNLRLSAQSLFKPGFKCEGYSSAATSCPLHDARCVVPSTVCELPGSGRSRLLVQLDLSSTVSEVRLASICLVELLRG